MRKKRPLPKSDTESIQMKRIGGKLVPSHYVDGRMNYCCGKCGGRLEEGRWKSVPCLYCVSCFKVFHFGFWGHSWDVAVRFLYEVTTA